MEVHHLKTQRVKSVIVKEDKDGEPEDALRQDRFFKTCFLSAAELFLGHL